MSPKTYTICEKCHQFNRVPVDSPAGKAPICGKCKTALSIHGGVSEVSPEGLELLKRKSPVPVVIDFWAPWCGPCKAFAPTFNQAARELADRVVLAKIDTEAHPNSTTRYKIRGIPTLILFKGGIEIDRSSGALPLSGFLQWVNSHCSFTSESILSEMSGS